MILRVEAVSKRFGGLTAVCNLSFAIETGSLVVLIGPNGAGKTTLLNLISGLEKVDNGDVYHDDLSITDLCPHEIAQRGIARTFQILKGFSQLTLLENVMVGRHTRTKSGFIKDLFSLPSARVENRRTCDFALDMLRFVGLENQAHRRLAELPEGSKRLVELARALASEPRLLLLDEPCAGLNPSEVDMLHQALKSVQAQGVTIFLVEHNMRLVMRIAEKIIVLNFGQKIAEGPPEVVSKDLAVIEAYLGKEHGTVSA